MTMDMTTNTTSEMVENTQLHETQVALELTLKLVEEKNDMIDKYIENVSYTFNELKTLSSMIQVQKKEPPHSPDNLIRIGNKLDELCDSNQNMKNLLSGDISPKYLLSSEYPSECKPNQEVDILGRPYHPSLIGGDIFC
jgi:hypothetical protein